ncbi:MAG TPA: ADOP family duplicated permease, partial [Candidatus Solibacter sp.]|nr:ADOP family duplicated permease [Candidatus Solibacter sp.]
IGVMPESFQFPYRAVPTDLWIPFDIPINPNSRLEGVVARLRSGAAIATARNELDVMTRRIDTTHRRGVVLTSVVETVSGKVRTPLFTLLGAVGLVLFIACANVANLLLARSARRSHEIAVRAALGAGRWRLIQQLLTESVLLSTAGAAAGLALAAVLMRVGVRLAGTKIPRSWEIGLDWRVFLFLLSVSVATGIAFGLLPALAVSRTDPQEALGGSSNRAVGASHRGWSGRWLRDGLVVAEIAVSFILLVSAGLVMRAFLRLQNTPVGLNPHDVLTLRLPAAYRDYPAPGDLGRYLMTVEQRVRQVPGVRTAGFIQFLPLQNWGWTAGFSIRGRPAPADGAPLRCDLRYVSPGYFDALRIPIVRGRAFTEHDVFGQPTSIVVNEALAHTYFPGEDPVGRVTDRGTIIGVAGDVRASGLDHPATPEIYYAVAQNAAVTSDAGMTLVVSSATPAATLAPAIRDAIRQINRYQVVYQIKPMDQVIAASLADMNLYTWLIGVFAGIAALLAVSGVYGVIAYAVAARTQEFGLRVALGAGGSQILGLVFRHGAVMVAMGLLVGIGGTFATGRLLESLLRGAKPADLPTLAAVALVLAIAGFAACAAPARRAMQVDPNVALRSL